MNKHAAGFTLIELMIAVAVVAVLSAIAYPSYVAHVQRSKRAEARAVLVEAAQYLQRFMVANDRYDQDRTGAAMVLPPSLSASPRDGAPAYSIRVVPGSLQPDAYILEAAPLLTDRCGALRLDQAGRRSLHGADTEAALADCWR